MPNRLGKHQQKLLLLLLGGAALILNRSPSKSFDILSRIKKGWENIDEYNIKRAIKSLYSSKLINERANNDGTFTLMLSYEGKRRALTYDLKNMRIKRPKIWDRKWRVVLFDIPESLKKERENFRHYLKEMSFFEFQKSVFVHPYNCKQEIEYLIEFYNIRRFVRFIIAYSLDNELHLKKHFNLIK